MVKNQQNPCTDHITNLPFHIIGEILAFLPFREAVRTSVLSKPWRRLWTHTSHIDLDNFLIPKDAHPNRWAVVVDCILSTLQGSPIVSCFLHCPNNYFYPYVDINGFLLILVQSGIQNLTLKSRNDNQIHTIPLHLIGCKTLTHICLRGCQIPLFPPTYRTSDFCTNLKTLKLNSVLIPNERDITLLISSCILLETLALSFCENVRHLSIRNPNLSNIFVWSSSPITVCLEDAPCLIRVKFFYGFNELDKGDWEAPDLIQLLKLPVLVEDLEVLVSPVVIKIWPSIKPPLSTFINLKRLYVHVRPTEANIVSILAWLLRSSPHLKELRIMMISSKNEPTAEIDFWDKQSSFTCLTHHLLTVKLDIPTNLDEDAVRFIKYLLTNTPVLKKMYIDLLYAEDKVHILPMKTASPNADIIVTVNSPISRAVLA